MPKQQKEQISRAEISQGPEGWLKARFPYNAALVAELKDTFPVGHRKWDPDSQCWFVSDLYAEELVAMLGRYFTEVVANIKSAEKTSENPFYDALAALPEAHIDRVFRSIAQAVHPDVGGTDALMKQLNDAYASVKNKALKKP